MKKEPYPKAGAAPSIFMFCVLRGDYSRRVSLMISSNVSPKRSAAFLHSTIRSRKISKYYMTGQMSVSIVMLKRQSFCSLSIFSEAFTTA